MTLKEKEKFKNNYIGKIIDYYSPAVHRLFNKINLKNKNKNIFMKQSRSFRCKIINIEFIERIKKNFLITSFRKCIKIESIGKNIIFHDKFKDIEKIKIKNII